MNPFKTLLARLFRCAPKRPYEAPGPDSVGISAVSPSIKLEVVEVPRDAMGSDPRERMRLTAGGQMFFKRDDGSVYTVVAREDGFYGTKVKDEGPGDD